MKKNITRVISCLLVLMLAISSLCIVSVSASDPNIYDRTSVSASLSGAGTEADPYLINNGADLAYLVANHVAGAYYKQTADIYWSAYVDGADAPAASNWTPIVNFNGTYDGNGFALCGVYFNDPAAENIGLFGTASGTIKNLTLKDSAIHAGKYVGSIVGSAIIGTPEAPTALTIENCANYANVTAAIKNSELGGIIGSAFSTPKDDGGDMTIVISKCVNYGTIEAKLGTGYVGGIVGRLLGNHGSTVSECINFGKVSAETAVAGGIVGQTSLNKHANYDNTHSIVLSDCLNAGDVSAKYVVGGLVGRAYGLTTIQNCVVTGTVTANVKDGSNDTRFNALEIGDGSAHIGTVQNTYYVLGCAVNLADPTIAPGFAPEGGKTLEEINSAAMATLLGDKWTYNETDGLTLVAFATTTDNPGSGDSVVTVVCSALAVVAVLGSAVVVFKIARKESVK